MAEAHFQSSNINPLYKLTLNICIQYFGMYLIISQNMMSRMHFVGQLISGQTFSQLLISCFLSE